MEYIVMNDENEIQDDYDYARAKYCNLAEKGDEAIDLMLDLARESEHPRAFEVLSNMLKQNAEVADRLMELQKKKKEVRLIDQKQLPSQMTQNNVYVGSTTDLQRMMHKRIDENSTTIDQDTDDDGEE
jgi:ubiquinone biosynthesis protein Coq4